MKRRTFSREFKIEAVKLVMERGVAVAQACRELELSESVLRRWMRELDDAPLGAFPGNGRVSAEQAEIDSVGAGDITVAGSPACITRLSGPTRLAGCVPAKR